MRSSLLRPALALAAFTLSPLALAASTDPTLAQAEQLLGQKQPRSAYELLAPLEDERGGDPDYDYLLGLSALESGQGGAAAFAFERCLATDPKNGPCRVQMARTHLALGENQSAREELKTLQEYNPPPEVQQQVSRYLGSLDKRELDAKRHFGAYAQIGMGHDGNANSANSTSQIAVAPIGGTVLTLTVNPADRDQSDSFIQGAAGGNFRYSLSPAWSLIGDLDLNTRGYQDVDRYNYLSGDLDVGVGYQAGVNQLQLKALAQQYQLDGDSYRSLLGAMAQYQYLLTESSQLSAYVQAVRLDYNDQDFRNADRYTFGGAWSQALQAPFQPVLYAGLYGGSEKLRDDIPQFDYLNQSFYGIRGGGTLFFTSALQLNSSLSIEHRKFDAPYPVAIPTFITREETQYDATLGLIYKVSPEISVRPAYTYTQSASNIIINEYHRNVLSLDFRYEL